MKYHNQTGESGGVRAYQGVSNTNKNKFGIKTLKQGLQIQRIKREV